MTRVLVCLLLASSCFANPVSSPPPTLSPTPPFVDIPPGAKRVKLAVKSPRPKYPLEARKHHWTGVGWFVMHVNKSTGEVTSVEILQSTGHTILDKACVDALKRWMFVPNKVRKVKTPITFAMAPNEKA
jgi:TonB family protein